MAKKPKVIEASLKAGQGTKVTGKAEGPTDKRLARVEAPGPPETAVERMARDPGIDVEKLRALIDMQTALQARTAEEQFNAAMSAAQKAMRPIAADASNPQTHSRYASYAALDRALRPIYTAHGFGVSFNTGEGAAPECVRVLAYVAHSAGFQRTYHVDMPADGKGAKGGDVMTKTHATGSALSYGMRYLQKMIWNVAVGEDDDDGNGAGWEPSRQREPREDPNGHLPITDFSTIGPDGTKKVGQRQRLYVIAKKVGRSETELKMWLKARYGLNSTKEIRRRDYNEIVACIEAPGRLPMEDVEAREPGSDDQ